MYKGKINFLSVNRAEELNCGRTMKTELCDALFFTKMPTPMTRILLELAYLSFKLRANRSRFGGLLELVRWHRFQSDWQID